MRKLTTTAASAVAVCLLLSACGPADGDSVSASTFATGNSSGGGGKESEQIANAEGFIDAFYSFDAETLAATLASAENSAAVILSYQGWAEGAHYKVLDRHGCQIISVDYVECPVTVEDDLLLNLGSDFKVTDQFNLRFDGTSIISVTTESDDPALVGQAFDWVFVNHPEFAEGPCVGFELNELETPQECADAVTTAFREFAASEDFPGD